MANKIRKPLGYPIPYRSKRHGLVQQQELADIMNNSERTRMPRVRIPHVPKNMMLPQF